MYHWRLIPKTAEFVQGLSLADFGSKSVGHLHTSPFFSTSHYRALGRAVEEVLHYAGESRMGVPLLALEPEEFGGVCTGAEACPRI